MAQVLPPGSIVVADWHQCKDSKEYFSKILHKKRRKNFGIETTVVYWPAKLRESGRVLFFRLQLWDCGENALRRFDHLLPSCKEQVDAVLFLFSFTDRTSFDDLSNQIAKWTGPSAGRVVKLVVGTKFDLFMHCDVAERDVKDFQETWSIPVLRMGGEVSDGLGDVAPLLNCLAENLWHHDCVAAGSASHHSQTETGTQL
ncbi:REM2- and [Collichthys lucidus]|uniref:Ciliogenesis and planar polarity effector 2 n=1 Tax=Collichthys lucidus TaxID=240159 RepID=A0A4U5UDK6_COLLU|nr:REM2- and [Collichthys lucidus]